MGVTGGTPLGFDVGAPPGQGGTLKGLDYGVRGMRVGGRRKLRVPPELVRVEEKQNPSFSCFTLISVGWVGRRG